MNRSEFESIIEEIDLVKELAREIPIIVEGRNDERALRALGIDAQFYYTQRSTSFIDLCDSLVGYKEIILFTDIDRAGEKIAKKIKSCLSQRGVRVIDKHRNSLLGKLDTHQVEHIYTRFKRIEASFDKSI